MHLIYFDESGNTGCNLDDSQQPVFLLGALVVPASCWQKLEQDLLLSLAIHLPDLAKADVEVHAADIRNGSGAFKHVPPATRVALRDDWLKIAQDHKLKFCGRPILKKQFQKWVIAHLGAGVKLNPYIAAFAHVAQIINDHLTETNSLGLFISDENKDVVRDIEKSVRVLRLTDGPLKLSQVIEKGFFIDSSKSRALQLCDLCTLYARKSAEAALLSKPLRKTDKDASDQVEKLSVFGVQKFGEVMAWLKEQHAEQKK